MDDALDGMRAKGWMDGNAFSDYGRRFREQIESDTDAMEVPIADAIGSDLDELLGILRPWARAIVSVGIAGGGYPGDANAISGLGRARG
jgi:hypothetical protein